MSPDQSLDGTVIVRLESESSVPHGDDIFGDHLGIRMDSSEYMSNNLVERNQAIHAK